MNKYLAYTFLYDDAADLKCDFELLSDELSSMIGLLRSLLDDADRRSAPEPEDDLSRLNELARPSTKSTVSRSGPLSAGCIKCV